MPELRLSQSVDFPLDSPRAALLEQIVHMYVALPNVALPYQGLAVLPGDSSDEIARIGSFSRAVDRIQEA